MGLANGIKDCQSYDNDYDDDGDHDADINGDDDDDDALMVLANGKTGDVADCQSEARVW